MGLWIGLLPYIGIDPTNSALVYKTSRLEDEDFSMRMSLLKKYVIGKQRFFTLLVNILGSRFPRVRVCTDLQDAHLYIFNRWVLDLVADKEKISSISEDLIPMLVKCQYQKKMVEQENVSECKIGWKFSYFFLLTENRCKSR